MSAPEIVADPERVTPEWLTAVLRFAGDVREARVVSFESERVGTGQVGENVRYRLAYDRAEEAAPASVVCKFASDDPTSRETGKSRATYVKEVRFYQQIAPTVDIRIPRCLFADIELPDQAFVIVMEDLAPARQGDQIEGCNVDQADLALTELARLHAPRWADPSLGEIDWLVGMSDAPQGGALLQGMYQAVWPGFVQRFGERLPPERLALAERLGSGLQTWAAGAGGPRTVAHGDYRLDNMLFGTKDGGYPLTVVDWQTPSHGNGPSDAAYFLGAGLHVDDRRAHEERLMNDYHARLVAGGVSGYDWNACWEDYRRYTFSGVIMAVIASMTVGESERGDDMFTAMATRHAQHALDLGADEFLKAG